MAKKALNPLDNMEFGLPTLEQVSETEEPRPQPQTKAKRTPKTRKARQTNMLLPSEQLSWIDKKHTEANSRSLRSFRKTAIVRAVFDAVMSANIDLSGVVSEEEIKERVITAMSEAKP